MTEEQLFSKDTFINLFNLNEVDRIEQEDRLFCEARKLGVEKRFKESLKKYQGVLSKKIPIESGLNLPKCKYDIENYNMSNYTCNINGISDKFNTKFNDFRIHNEKAEESTKKLQKKERYIDDDNDYIMTFGNINIK